MDDNLGFYEFPDEMKTELLRVYRVDEALTENYAFFYGFVHAHRNHVNLSELSNSEMKKNFFEIVTQIGINNFMELPNKVGANIDVLLARHGYSS